MHLSDIRWVHLLMFQHYYLHFGGSFMSKNGHFMLVVTRGGVFLFFVFIIYSRGWLYNDRKLCQDMITWLFVLQKKTIFGEENILGKNLYKKNFSSNHNIQ